jgi:predicted small metal-binding protein
MLTLKRIVFAYIGISVVIDGLAISQMYQARKNVECQREIIKHLKINVEKNNDAIKDDDIDAIKSGFRSEVGARNC